MSEEPKKKTPSPKVIASFVLSRAIADVYKVTAEEMGVLCDTRVSDDKFDKVQAQLAKIADKFSARINGTINKFEGIPKKKKKTVDAKVEKAKAKLSKKKKKRDDDEDEDD